MPPAKKLKTAMTVPLADGGKLTGSSTKILSPGYLVLFQNDLKKGIVKIEESNRLSELDAGTYHGTVENAEVLEKETKPPSRYTKASLNKDMTRIAKFVDDQKVKELLLQKDKDKKGENGSIGTVATRADIIEKLIQRGFIEEDSKKRLISTPLGRELYRILPDELRKPNMTAQWWVVQEDIKNGQATVDDLTEAVLKMINEFLSQEHPTVNMEIIPTNLLRGKGAPRASIGTCPRCGKPIIEGKMGFGCSGWKEGCRYVVWKKYEKISFMRNTSISAKEAARLIGGKKILKKNLTSKAGNKFEGYISLEDDPSSPYGPKINLTFKEKKGKK